MLRGAAIYRSAFLSAPETKNAPCRGVNSRGGEAGIRTLVTGFTGKTVFETAAFNRSATSPRGEIELVKMAEGRGFEPRIRFWRIHDFQSCSFGQLGHLSASVASRHSGDAALKYTRSAKTAASLFNYSTMRCCRDCSNASFFNRFGNSGGVLLFRVRIFRFR